MAEPIAKKAKTGDLGASEGNEQQVSVWASLFVELSDSPYATFHMEFNNGLGITGLKIAESVKLRFGRLLQHVSASDLHVFSGRNHLLLLSEDEVWSPESFGGGSIDDALRVKVATPVAAQNQGISDGTCRFCY